MQVDLYGWDDFQAEGSRSEGCSLWLLLTTDGSSAEMNSVPSAQVRLCESLRDLGAESPEELAQKEWLQGGMWHVPLGNGKNENLRRWVWCDTLAARKLETLLVSTEGCKTRIGSRRSCCAIISWYCGKMRKNCKVTLTKSELIFVFEGHVEGKGKKQKHLGSVMCYERCWWLKAYWENRCVLTNVLKRMTGMPQRELCHQ